MASQKYWDNVRKYRGCETLGITSEQWSYIKRVGTILNNLYTASCNGEGMNAEGYPEEEARYERRALLFAKNNKLHLYLQTDPRGATIYLDKKPIPENNYTNAVCIY